MLGFNPPNPFSFYGFLPREKAKREALFRSLQGPWTYLFFEGVSRIIDTVNILEKTRPSAQVAICRELTKKFQQVLRFEASDWQKEKEK